jgi:crotonobetainyl-CoA:carnitine CoA-transferase CaiB-like acyl-CoA transferase
VLEVAGGVSAAYCAGVLADLEADVLIADEAQACAGFRADPEPMAQGLRQSLDRNKHWLRVEAETESWRRLVRWADIAVLDGSDSRLRELAGIAQLPPYLITVGLSHFGFSGPRADILGIPLRDAGTVFDLRKTSSVLVARSSVGRAARRSGHLPE